MNDNGGTTDTLSYAATTPSEAAFSDVPPIPAAVPEPDPRGELETKSLTVQANEFAGDAGTCRVWLDGPASELLSDDIEVVHQSQAWPASPGCQDDLAWSLSEDAEGTWLELCPAACAMLRETPQTSLFISVKYYTKPPWVAR